MNDGVFLRFAAVGGLASAGTLGEMAFNIIVNNWLF
jgi:hypothetical protein